MSHSLPFEIGDQAKFTGARTGSMAEMRNRRAVCGIRVVGLDTSEDRSIKVGFFMRGSGQLYDWVTPREITKLNAVERLAQIDT